MKMAVKTLKKVVFEISTDEMIKTGFDNVWDNIRKDYPEMTYDLHAIESDQGDEVMFFELTPKLTGS